MSEWSTGRATEYVGISVYSQGESCGHHVHKRVSISCKVSLELGYYHLSVYYGEQGHGCASEIRLRNLPIRRNRKSLLASLIDEKCSLLYGKTDSLGNVRGEIENGRKKRGIYSPSTAALRLSLH